MTDTDLRAAESPSGAGQGQEAPADTRPLTTRVAGSAGSLAGRRLVLMVLSAIATAVITRILGPTRYGQYGSAIATWTLIGAAADFGFSLALTRDLPLVSGSLRPVVRAALRVAVPWSCVLAVALVGIALSVGLDTGRGQAMLVLAPSLAAFGLVPARAVFMVLYKTGEAVRIDIAVVVVQSVLVVVAALVGLGVAGVAAVVSLTTTVNMVLVWRRSERHLGPREAAPYTWRAFSRRALPLGLLSLMTQVYFMIDLVIIGFYLEGPSVGEYAGASKLLTVFTGVTGLVTAAALPAFSAKRRDPEELHDVMTSVWHWLMMTAVPVFIGLGLFAPLVIDVALGPQFDGARLLLEILAVAGLVSVANNFVGTLLVATERTRTLFYQNAVALTFNIGGNILLLPRYGVEAAAWLTLGTELITCTGAGVVVARQIGMQGLAGVSLRPLGAIALSTAVAVVCPGPIVAQLLSGLAVLLVAAWALRAWPAEFSARVRLLRSVEVRP